MQPKSKVLSSYAPIEMKYRSLACVLVICATWTSLFAPFVKAQTTEPTPMPEKEKKGLGIRLSEQPVNPFELHEGSGLRSPEPESLSTGETNEIFRRLPPMPENAAQESEFRLRPASLPPPKTGNVLPVKFPAATDGDITPPATSASKDLFVARYSTTGETGATAEVSVTFSQPMVAIGTQQQTAETVPVKMSPAVTGKWRWLGTNTIVFDAEKRYPMATEFNVEIPAGTRSASGSVLKERVFWSFLTTPPKIVKFDPREDPAGGNGLVLVVFDQDIVPQEILAKSTAESNGFKIPLKLATEAEIAAYKTITDGIKNLQPKRWMVLRALEGLPRDARTTFTFGPGLPSAEGPRVTSAAQSYAFQTRPPLRFVKVACGYRNDNAKCEPRNEINLRFTNQLDEKNFDPSTISIEPKISNARIRAEERNIEIQGDIAPRTTYKIKISGSLKDAFGQSLEKPASALVTTAPETPNLYGFDLGNELTVLDPHAKRRVSVISMNYKRLQVRLFAVQPEEFPAYLKWLENEKLDPGFGRPVVDKIVRSGGKPDRGVETRIDVTPAFSGGLGHALLIVEALDHAPGDDADQVISWLEATQIGLNANSDRDKIAVYASDLKNGRPLQDVELKLLAGGTTITGENGLGTLQLPTGKGENGVLIARRGNDSAILNERESSWNSESKWFKQAEKEDVRWFVFNDRNMYRPGETVSIKGYLRKVTTGVFTDIADPAGALDPIRYSLLDPLGNEVIKGTARANIFGAIDLKLKLPENINLGTQRLILGSDGTDDDAGFKHEFKVQEFRRPEFEVSTKSLTAAPYYVGGEAVIEAEAKYYSGGALGNAGTNWTVSTEKTTYSPPGHDDFTFGEFVSWWEDHYGSDYSSKERLSGTTSDDGRHRIKINIDLADPPSPYTIEAEASVTDVNRQQFASSTSLLVHPSLYYVGIRTPKTFVAPEEHFPVETIVTDIDGRNVPGVSVAVKAELMDWQKVGGEWKEIAIDSKSCDALSGQSPIACNFSAEKGGVFKITATVKDPQGRPNESEMTVWVAGFSKEPPLAVEEEDIELIPGKKEYSPGETAEILVNSPFYPAEGILTLERNGIVSVQRISIDKASTVVKIPVEERYLPNFHARVDLLGAATRYYYGDERDEKLPKRPAYATGSIDISVSIATRKLKVSAEAVDKTMLPGGKTRINIAVNDSEGRPAAGSEVAVVVVDESILALTTYEIADPVGEFYEEIDENVWSYHSRKDVILGDLDDEEKGFGFGEGSGSGSGDGAGSGGTPRPAVMYAMTGNMRMDGSSYDAFKKPVGQMDMIRMRSNFDALAIFSPSVITGSDGRAVIELTLPDNLTRYRVTAVAAADMKKFGKGESNITARQPLMVRPSAPRFMNFGDRAEIPVVVQNQTDKPMTANVAIRAANAKLELNGKKVYIRGNDRVEVRFPASVEKVGKAFFQVGAVSAEHADAAEFAFPVYTPATTEAFATYGTTDKNGAIVQPVDAPQDVFPQFGGLEITTGSTQLQELTDAFIYLQGYPYECTEQVSSRILSVAALRDTMAAFKASGLPPGEAIAAKMRADIDKLVKLQHEDGGFSYWKSNDNSIPYVSIHVAHALARANAKGYPVPSPTLKRAAGYLKNIESHFESYYSEETRVSLSAYAIYVRELLGDKDPGDARRLLRSRGVDKFWPETLGWLLGVMAGDKDSAAEIEAIKRALLNRVTETASTANFVTTYNDGEYLTLSSNRRSDAIVLEALLKADPENDLIPKIVRGLLAHRKAGRWINTQENVFSLLALDRYFHTYEKVTPSFVARVWLGSEFAGEQNFEGRSADSNRVNIPMEYLLQGGPKDLTIDRQGAGRLYYRIGLNYAPRNLNLGAADYGFDVSRKYEGVDRADDVKLEAKGSWTVKAGARVRVVIQIVAQAARHHVALVDRLPGGFEIVNPELAVSRSAPGNEGRRGWWSQWFQHENLRDDRAEAFTMELRAGVWEYSYIVTATTPGEFVAPPAKAEEMYAPETFGRSKSEIVRIK